MRAVILNKIGWCSLMLVILLASQADAQRRGGTRRKSATPDAAVQDASVVNPATGNSVAPPPPPPPSPGTSLRPDGIGTPVDTPRKSQRIDGISEKNFIKDRTPILYDHIRSDDEFWEKKIWQVIDTREKMNLPFQYNVEDENGTSQLFINIILNAIKSKEVEAFSPIDDRFTTPIAYDEIQNKLSGEEKTIRSIDPVTGEEKMVTTRDDFDPRTVVQYKIKEIWVFDKEASQLKVRILGIAPMVSRMNEDGSFRAAIPLFWVYYPDMRPILAKYDVYNQNNDAATMSWEDLFEMRFFTSYVTKENNTYNREIKDYIKDGTMRLLEGQAVKDKIFNKEQDMWQY
ncbi:type IX secretion system ring subunit PorN/GldN [Chitinophaga sancti]|uniref:Gliding motility associated protien GldN n=1 Tax=Chitinophaga sancti TaxID=1004 RepID=A0A1K1NVQ0_9BACT|nr:gliding motility protein GldN [Chitinophaga sancti]WQD60216.1 gliding motility protein GldN [Chitinophaga sancti]WQG87656.1 gliding motility protein GldN [Chitinophaga sancti]SFW39339.1 gliding motility associated protien GldN [Chitinophaga sancti]